MGITIITVPEQTCPIDKLVEFQTEIKGNPVYFSQKCFESLKKSCSDISDKETFLQWEEQTDGDCRVVSETKLKVDICTNTKHSTLYRVERLEASDIHYNTGSLIKNPEIFILQRDWEES